VYASDFDVAVTVASSAGGGMSAAKPKFGDLTIEKVLDSKSAALMSGILGGPTRWTTAKLELFAPGTTDVAHTYDLGNVALSSLRDRNTGQSGDTAATEDLTLGYQSIKESDGGATGCWDITANVACAG
jgi:type VI protein secretion system component Hcp